MDFFNGICCCAKCNRRVCDEIGKRDAQLAAANERPRTIAQRIIEAIGSNGPEDAEQAVGRVLAQLAAANAQRDELKCELEQLDIYLRCRGAAGETVLDRVKRMERDGNAAESFWQKAQSRGDVLQQQLDQCVREREALAKSYRETIDDRDGLLRIINDAFLSLHIPGSAKAFDGRNLVVHARDSAEVAMVLRGERDAARRDLSSLMAAAKSLTEDPNACWEDFLAAVDAIARAQSAKPDDAAVARHRDFAFDYGGPAQSAEPAQDNDAASGGGQP